MRYSIHTYAFTLLSLLAPVEANAPLTDSFIQDDMTNNNGFKIAWASRPMWHFGRMEDYKPCYPSAALINGLQHGTSPDLWPNAGTGCVDPGPGGKGNPFPTYYSVNFCGADELRVIYALYLTHDGFQLGGTAEGHTHDWEHVIVIWRRSDGLWTRRQLLKSFHDGYTEDSWDSVQSTINYDNISEDNGKNRNGAKIYVGWAKHAMFADVNASWRDKTSQGCSREFRSRDWWYLPERGDLVYASHGSAAGAEMANFDWGKADSGPWVVSVAVCSKLGGGYGLCKVIDAAFPPNDTGSLEKARKTII